MKRSFSLIFFFFCIGLAAQNRVSFIVADSVSGEALPGTIVRIDELKKGASSSADGSVLFHDLPSGEFHFSFSLTGYKQKIILLELPLADSLQPVKVMLQLSAKEMEEVVIASSRTNSRIEDLNMKVEVLGQEDMDEESAIVPGTVTSILGDLAVITVQRTNPVNANDVIRMQGLDGRYTQIMRDGLPLYGGFSGSLGVLSIPPLDLQQVEIIKGAASTLYGGGAIAGLINFVSKTPQDSAVNTFTLNATSLKEYDLNAFSSGKIRRFGYTAFGGWNARTAADVNGDGFSDVPDQLNAIFRPRFFFDINARTKLNIGFGGSIDNRAGGDMIALRQDADSLHVYKLSDRTQRYTADFNLQHERSETQSFQFKSSFSFFDRIYTLPGFSWQGSQYSSFTELNQVHRFGHHTLIAGLNLLTETFDNRTPSVLPGDYSYASAGVFAQDEWQIWKKFSLCAGLRYDYHSRFKGFLLPRISLYYRRSDALSFRLSGGTGYKAPNVFDFYPPSPGLGDLPANIRAEHSSGLNADINYSHAFGEEWSLQLNQAFYYTRIPESVLPAADTSGLIVLMNSAYTQSSIGTDTYLRIGYDDFELYLGYNHTFSQLSGPAGNYNTPFNPQDKFSCTLAYDDEKHWRGGIEASWTGNQFVENNTPVPSFWFTAAMVQYRFSRYSLVLNCENLFDSRQSRYGPMYSGTVSSPQFVSPWGPVEGRVLNLSVKISL